MCNRGFVFILCNFAVLRIYSLFVEKRKTGPALQIEEKFYVRMLGYLLKYILAQHDLGQFKEVLVFTDSIPLQKKRATIEKALKTTLASLLPATARYRVVPHGSKSNLDPPGDS